MQVEQPPPLLFDSSPGDGCPAAAGLRPLDFVIGRNTSFFGQSTALPPHPRQLLLMLDSAPPRDHARAARISFSLLVLAGLELGKLLPPGYWTPSPDRFDLAACMHVSPGHANHPGTGADCKREGVQLLWGDFEHDRVESCRG